jgi:hypothetical protein
VGSFAQDYLLTEGEIWDAHMRSSSNFPIYTAGWTILIFPNNLEGGGGGLTRYISHLNFFNFKTVKYRYEISQHYHCTQKGMVMADKVKRTGQIQT